MKVASNVNTTKVFLENSQKNLGVNGTGQRKNITLTQPISQNNDTATKPALQNITLTDETNDDHLSVDNFPPDEDSEAFNKTLAEHHITNSTEVRFMKPKKIDVE